MLAIGGMSVSAAAVWAGEWLVNLVRTVLRILEHLAVDQQRREVTPSTGRIGVGFRLAAIS